MQVQATDVQVKPRLSDKQLAFFFGLRALPAHQAVTVALALYGCQGQEVEFGVIPVTSAGLCMKNRVVFDTHREKWQGDQVSFRLEPDRHCVTFFPNGARALSLPLQPGAQYAVYISMYQKWTLGHVSPAFRVSSSSQNNIYPLHPEWVLYSDFHIGSMKKSFNFRSSFFLEASKEAAVVATAAKFRLVTFNVESHLDPKYRLRAPPGSEEYRQRAEEIRQQLMDKERRLKITLWALLLLDTGGQKKISLFVLQECSSRWITRISDWLDEFRVQTGRSYALDIFGPNGHPSQLFLALIFPTDRRVEISKGHDHQHFGRFWTPTPPVPADLLQDDKFRNLITDQNNLRLVRFVVSREGRKLFQVCVVHMPVFAKNPLHSQFLARLALSVSAHAPYPTVVAGDFNFPGARVKPADYAELMPSVMAHANTHSDSFEEEKSGFFRATPPLVPTHANVEYKGHPTKEDIFLGALDCFFTNVRIPTQAKYYFNGNWQSVSDMIDLLQSVSVQEFQQMVWGVGSDHIPVALEF